MYKYLIFLISIVLFSSRLFAQDWNEIYYLEGEAQYLVDEKKYDNAIDVYRRMLKEVPKHSLAKYRIGQLYLLTDDQKELSIEYLEEASQDIALDFNEKSLREVRTPVDVLLYLGQAYQTFNRIDEAITVYNNFKNLINPENEFYPIVLQRLASCENAKSAIVKPERVVVKNLGAPLNDDKSNFGAVISGDGQTMVFTSYTRNYIDLYSAKKVNGVWAQPKKITEKVSSKYYLRSSSLSYDGNELYLATDDADNNDIYVSLKEGRSWANTYKLGKKINGKKSNETHACVSKDGNTLYFTSNREGGLGGLDIYKSQKGPKGDWGEPENLGSNVNTAFNEETPFITPDGRFLFFSSQGHSSIGGYDIFYVDLAGGSNAINLGYPANSFGNDLFFVPDNSTSSGFISRYDTTSVGKNDIYYLTILPKINLAGVVKNSANNENINESDLKISLVDTEGGDVAENIQANNGRFNFEINPGKYLVSVSSENFEPVNKEILIPEDYSEAEFPFEAMLKPLETEEPELVAEVVEPEVIEETPVLAVVEEIVPEPIVEEVVEEKLVEPVVEEESEIIEEKPKPIVPEKKVVKYVPKTTVVSGQKTYSVQLMALRIPVEVNYFKDIDGVQLKKYEDGFYRYTVGSFETYAEAQSLKKQIHELGYTDSYVRVNNVTPKYTIQIMALIIPVKPEYFKTLSSVAVTKGADDYYRYTVGDYASFSDAKDELSKIAELGYPNAYIKRTN
ncbi:MAG: PD40 domain-containing protein [Bacteroidales bacterium]|nr:PD40 domain-containing protein [Bacteroidales bacterium]